MLYYIGVTRVQTALLTTGIALVIGMHLAAEAAPETWKRGETESAEILAKRLGRKDAPLVLHVGDPALYEASHIPGAKVAGPGASPEGIKRLRAAVKGVPKDREIVIYCGCCPWQDCPNVRPAYKALEAAGYKKVKALDLPDDFTIDWAKRGHPVAKGKF